MVGHLPPTQEVLRSISNPGYAIFLEAVNMDISSTIYDYNFSEKIQIHLRVYPPSAPNNKMFGLRLSWTKGKKSKVYENKNLLL